MFLIISPFTVEFFRNGAKIKPIGNEVTEPNQ